MLASNLEAFLVGGYLRDSLLGRTTHDIDIVVRGDAEETGKALASHLDGTLVVLGKDERVARVALQPEGSSDIPWQIDLTSTKGDILDDLERRDLTIDAMAVPLSALGQDGYAPEVIDLFSGLEDLEKSVIRAVRDDAFRRDPARLLRALRIAAELNFSLEPETQSLIKRDATLLTQVAAERARVDLCSILATDHSYRWLRLMDELGLMSILLPGLDEARGVSQPKEHHWDVYDHSVETVGVLDQMLSDSITDGDEFIASLSWVGEYSSHLVGESREASGRRAVVKLAGLLHDVGKPRMKTIEDSGRIRFFGHPEVGAEMTEDILRRLRFTRRETKLARDIVLHHLRPGLMSNKGHLPTDKAIYRYFRDTGDAAVDTVLVNLADYRAARGPLLDGEEWRSYSEQCRHILYTGLYKEREQYQKPLVTGHDLMEEFELSPGPLIGRLLEEVKEASAIGEVSTKEEALELVGKNLGWNHARR